MAYEKQVALQLYLIEKGVTNLSDAQIARIDTTRFLDEAQGVHSFSYLDLWCHYARHCSRTAILKLLGPARDYWFKGSALADVQSKVQRADGLVEAPASMAARQTRYERELHDEQTFLILYE